jgi:hypothetical protein
MKDQSSISGYAYANAQNTHAHAYLLPSVNAELAVVKERLPPPSTLRSGLRQWKCWGSARKTGVVCDGG